MNVCWCPAMTTSSYAVALVFPLQRIVVLTDTTVRPEKYVVATDAFQSERLVVATMTTVLSEPCVVVEVAVNNMRPLGHSDTLKIVAKALGKWCMFISVYANGEEDIALAAPYLANITDGDSDIFVFDSEQECRDTFNQTVGDDGPTVSNPYDGPCKIYAVTCDNNGNLQQENT